MIGGFIGGALGEIIAHLIKNDDDDTKPGANPSLT